MVFFQQNHRKDYSFFFDKIPSHHKKRCILKKWNPESYLKFANERTQPSYDLASRIAVKNPAKIADLGCGPGNSTAVLKEKWPQAQIIGLDNSAEMIEKAQKLYPHDVWVLSNVTDWKPTEEFDIIFSNAVFHWLPNHETLLKDLFAFLNPGGALAVQIPANFDSPMHYAMICESKMPEWNGLFENCEKEFTVHGVDFYYDQLSLLSDQVFIWETIYYHVMASCQDLIDWHASTGMKVFLEKLAGEEQKNRFKNRVLENIRSQYPAQQDKKILFPFKRLFFIAYRGV